MTPHYPFAALHGQDELRLALLLVAIDPRIGGVLIEGPRGTAKSTSARALADLLADGLLVNLPLGSSEEQLAGSLDIQAALRDGEVAFRPGLLARADGGVLYVDEVNLLADSLVDLLLDVCASGVNRIERDGISHQHAARIALVGTMNPEEGELRPQLLDRFGLLVRLGQTIEPEQRERIVRSRLQFDRDPQAFVARYQAQQQVLSERLGEARRRVVTLEFSDALYRLVSRLCHGAGVEGVRADLVMLRAAAAHAAWQGRDEVGEGDVRAVAELVLAHRRKNPPEPSADSGAQPPSSASSSMTGEGLADTSDDGDWGAMPPQAVAIQEPTARRPRLEPSPAKKP
ncbi:ATP-binding protein [Stutzerimonas kirkiae]|uniref:ATP-binding protein n=1 Tax=Stutzerimonas kirkiae TaxID=2211392 RepID=UPI001038490C|nr:AAA family ATPase [Stutzerimonas kirkiae]TBV11398.1 magnesium chelatase [Stutzerimonas kirkiae]